MKNILKLALLISFVVLFPHGISFATSLGFNQSDFNLNAGESFTANLNISGLGEMSPQSLSIFDIDVTYNSNVLSLSSVTFGDPVLGDQLDLFGLGSVTGTVPSVDEINVFELSLDFASDLDTLQAGVFTLFSLNFDTIASGNSMLDITINSLGNSSGASILSVIENSNVVVAGSTPAPEPNTMFLVSLGLLSLAGVYRRRKKA